MSKKYKVAIKIGHTQKAQGAYSDTLKESEYKYNTDVANLLKNNANCEIDYDIYTFDSTISSYTQRQVNVAKILNEKRYDLVVELHYNSAESHTAKGVCVLYYYASVKGRRASEIVGDQISKDFGTERDADIPLKTSNQNGFQAVSTPKDVAILVEPFFGSNPQESKLFAGITGKTKYAKSLHTGILAYLKSLG